MTNRKLRAAIGRHLFNHHPLPAQVDAGVIRTKDAPQRLLLLSTAYQAAHWTVEIANPGSIKLDYPSPRVKAPWSTPS